MRSGEASFGVGDNNTRGAILGDLGDLVRRLAWVDGGDGDPCFAEARDDFDIFQAVGRQQHDSIAALEAEIVNRAIGDAVDAFDEAGVAEFAGALAERDFPRCALGRCAYA